MATIKQPNLTLRQEFADLKFRLESAECKIEALRKLTEPGFQKWCDEIDRLARDDHDFRFDLTSQTGRDCWRQFYEAGYDPESALLEDLGND